MLHYQPRRITSFYKADIPHQGSSSTNTNPALNRKHRSDAGKERVTKRDLRVLQWIGEMMVIRFDHLQCLLARWSSRAVIGDRLAETSTRDVVRRWIERGYVVTRHLDGSTWVWLTAFGQAEAHLPYKKTFSGRSKDLRHYFHCNQVRLDLEAAYKDYNEPFEWVSERELVRLRIKAGDSHYADALVRSGTSVAAIEIELTGKNHQEGYQDILALSRSYNNIWFYVTVKSKTNVLNRISRLEREYQKAFTIIQLEESY